MELWKISPIQSSQNSTQDSAAKESSSTGVSIKSEYAKILADKIASAKDDMERMSEIQEELDENNKLHEELTGETPDDDSSNSSSRESTETIKRFMPDGSILFMKVRGGEVVEQFEKKPHFVAVADPSAPKTVSGTAAVKMKAMPQLDLFSLLI